MTYHELAVKIILEKDTLTVEEIEQLIKKYAEECVERFNRNTINIGI